MTSKSERYLRRIRGRLKQTEVYSSENIINQFKRKYGYLSKFGLQITGAASLNDDYHVISVSTPFIFDNRLLPKSFMGLDIRCSISDLPKDFQDINPAEAYIWAYQRFEYFVDNNISLIREKLNNPNMTKDEMLDALCFGDFQSHKDYCIKKEIEGEIPKFKK